MDVSAIFGDDNKDVSNRNSQSTMTIIIGVVLGALGIAAVVATLVVVIRKSRQDNEDNYLIPCASEGEMYITPCPLRNEIELTEQEPGVCQTDTVQSSNIEDDNHYQCIRRN